MRPASLVLISGKDPDQAGGHESYVRAHALAGVRLGYQPHVFCVGSRAAVTEAEYGFVHRVAAASPVALQPRLLARSAASFLARAPRPHIVHGFAIWSAAAVALARRSGGRATALASAYGTRAFEIEAMQPALGAHLRPAERLRYRTWLRWVRLIDDRVEGAGYRGAELVLVNYESVAQILARAYGAAVRTRRLPYASADALAPRDRPSVDSPPASVAALSPGDAPLVVAVSRHDPRKGLDRLLLALERLDACRVPFRACIVGPGRLLDSHRRLAAELGLQRSVAITGRVPDVNLYLACADLFVLPSLGEASGSVSVIEALAAGLPVLASACDGIPEDLTDGQDAILVAPGDVPELAKKLATMLSDPGLRARLSVAARAAHARLFSPERFVAALGRVYDEAGRGELWPAPSTTRGRPSRSSSAPV